MQVVMVDNLLIAKNQFCTVYSWHNGTGKAYSYIATTESHCKNVVYYMALRSANHTVIRVVNTTQCHIIHQLVWYAHFIFYSVAVAMMFTSGSPPQTSHAPTCITATIYNYYYTACTPLAQMLLSATFFVYHHLAHYCKIQGHVAV